LNLAGSYEALRAEATSLAGEPGDLPRRASLLHAVYLDSGRNHAFPQIALHGALWAAGFFETTGTLGRLVSWRYFYDRAERERRHAMLHGFWLGFQEANRSVFLDTWTNYLFSKRHGRERGAETVLRPELLTALNAVHEAARRGLLLDPPERRGVFEVALRWEQEATVGPRVKEEVARFDCPILRRLVLKPVVRFRYFPRWKRFWFRDFSDTDERIARAMESYDLAERAGWDRVEAAMRRYKTPPDATIDPCATSLSSS